MAKTFKTTDGKIIEIDKNDTYVSTDEDIVTGQASNYFVESSDYKAEVNQDVYEAVKKYLEK